MADLFKLSGEITADLKDLEAALSQAKAQVASAAKTIEGSLNITTPPLKPPDTRGIEAAFKSLGLVSSRSLLEASFTADAAFKKISESGTATAGDIQRAYQAMQAAQKAWAQSLAAAPPPIPPSWIDNLQQYQQGLTQFGTAATRLGIGLSAGVTLPLVAAIREAGNFDSEMRKVTSLITGATEPEFQKLRGQVLEVSNALGVDAVKSTQALYQILSANIPKENAIDFLTQATKTAIAGVTDTATAVNGLTTVMAAYGLDVSHAREVSDAMFAAVKIGKLEFDQLSSSLSKTVGTAHSLGVSYEELLAAGATLTLTTGGSISESMTKLESAMKALLRPTGEMKPLLEAANTAVGNFGTASGAALIKTAGLGGALKAVSDAAGGKIEVLTSAFNRIEGLGGVLGLAGEHAKQTADQFAIVKGASQGLGATFAATEEINKGFNRQLEMMSTEAKNLAIDFGTTLLPIIRDDVFPAIKVGVEYLRDMVKWFETMPGPVRAAGEVLLLTFAVGGPLLIGLGATASGLSNIIGLLKIFSTSAVVAEGAAATTALTGLISKLGLGAPALLGFGAAVLVTYDNLKTMRGELEKAGDAAIRSQLFKALAAGKTIDDLKAMGFSLAQIKQALDGNTIETNKFSAAGINLGVTIDSLGQAHASTTARVGEQQAAIERLRVASQNLIVGLTGEQVAAGKVNYELERQYVAAMALINPLSNVIGRTADLTRAQSSLGFAIQASLADLNLLSDAFARAGVGLGVMEQGAFDANAALDALANSMPDVAAAAADFGAAMEKATEDATKGLDDISPGLRKVKQELTEMEKFIEDMKQSLSANLSRGLTNALFGFDRRAFNQQLAEQAEDLQRALADQTKQWQEHNAEVLADLEALRQDIAAKLAEEESDLAGSFNKKREEFFNYERDIEQQIEDAKAKSASATDSDVAKLRETLADKTAAYLEYHADVLGQIEELRASSAADLASDLQRLRDQLAERTEAYEEFVTDANTRLARISVDTEDDIGDQTRNTQRGIADKQKAYKRDEQDILARIAKLKKAGKKESDEEVKDLRLQLRRKKEDLDEYTTEAAEDLAEFTTEHRLQSERQTSDLQLELQRRTDDFKQYVDGNRTAQAQTVVDHAAQLAKQEGDLLASLQRRAAQLEQDRIDTAAKIVAVTATHAAEALLQEQNLRDSLAKRKTEFDTYSTEVLAKLEKLRTDADAKLLAAELDVSNSLKRSQAEYDTYAQGVKDKLQEIQDKNRTVWQDIANTALGTLTALAAQISDKLIASLLKPLTDKLADILGGLLGSIGIPGLGSAGGSGSGGGSGGGAAGGAVSSVLGWAQLGTAVADAVVGGLQRMAMNKTLDLIENYTRYAKGYLGEQSQSILWSTQTTAAWLKDSIGPNISRLTDSQVGQWQFIVPNLDEIKATLWRIEASFGNFSLTLAPSLPGVAASVGEAAQIAGASVFTSNVTFNGPVIGGRASLQELADMLGDMMFDRVRRAGSRI